MERKGIERFLPLADKKGWTYRKANYNQDTKEHWDYALTKETTTHLVDFKSMKKINIQDIVV